MEEGMKFIIEKTDFTKAMAVICGCQDSTLLPVYEMALLSAEAGKLRLRAFSLGCDVELTVPAQVEETGETAGNSDLLRALGASVGGSTVKFDVTDKRITLRGGNSVRWTPTFPAEEFPARGDFPSAMATWEAESLGRCLDRMLFCCASEGETSMPVLEGVCFDWGAGVMLATDRKKLAYQRFDADVVGLGGPSVLPARELRKLRQLASFGGSERVGLSRSDAKVLLSFGEASLAVNCLMGNFPSQLVAELKGRASEPAFRCGITIREFGRVATAIKALTQTARFMYPLRMRPEGDALALSLKVPEVGELRDEVRMLQVGGSLEEEVLLNSFELTQVFPRLEGELFRLSVCGSKMPVMVDAPAMEGWGLFMMPMVTQEEVTQSE